MSATRSSWVWLLSLAACQASRSIPETPGDADGGADMSPAVVPDASGPDASGLPDASAPMPGPSPWNDTSARIEVGCFAFFQGSMRFRADRAQLSAAQLQMLSELSVVDAGDGCVEDDVGCHLAITQADGSVVSYDSLAGDFGCGTPRRLVAFASFDPFRQTLGCAYAKGPVTALSPDPRCFNGLFSSGGATINQGLTVDGANAPHHVELDSCSTSGRVGHVSLQILDPTSTTVLATGTAVAAPGPDGTCLSVDYTFSQAGTYVMRAVADPTFTPGDFYVRFY